MHQGNHWIKNCHPTRSSQVIKEKEPVITGLRVYVYFRIFCVFATHRFCYTVLLISLRVCKRFLIWFSLWQYQSTFPCNNDHSEVLSAMPNDDRYARVAPEYHHRCLQVVELVGFSGHPDEVEFLSYWLVIAVSLSKLVINPLAPSAVAMGLNYENTKIRTARECAWQLQRKVPPKVKLVVLWLWLDPTWMYDGLERICKFFS